MFVSHLQERTEAQKERAFIDKLQALQRKLDHNGYASPDYLAQKYVYVICSQLHCNHFPPPLPPSFLPLSLPALSECLFVAAHESTYQYIQGRLN